MILNVDGARAQACRLLTKVFGRIVPTPVPLIHICRRSGIRVWRKPLESLDAIAFRENDGSIGILINSNTYPRRRSFSFAHEMGHIFCGHIFCDKNPDPQTSWYMERTANVFAAEITMPKRVVICRRWTVESLADEFHVSPAAARIRLEELGMTA